MIVGVPKEVKDDEYRVAMTPAGVRELTVGRATRSRRAGRGRGLVDRRRRLRRHRCARSSPTPTTSGPPPTSSCKVKEPVDDGVPPPRRSAGPGPLHVPAPRRVARLHRRPAGRAATRRSPTRRSACPTARSAADADERGGRPHGAAHGRAPPDAPGRRAGQPDLRRARRPAAERRHARRRGRRGWPPPRSQSGMHANVYILDRNLERLRQVDHHFRGALETVASSAARHRGGLRRRRHRDRRGARGRRQGAKARHRRPGRPDAPPARCSSTSRSTRAAASSRPARPRTRIPTFEVERVDLLLRRQHARRGPAHLHARAGQRHAAVHPGDRRPRLEGSGAGRSRPRSRRQHRRGSVVCEPVAEAHGLAYVPLASVL